MKMVQVMKSYDEIAMVQITDIETNRKNVFLCPMRCVGQIVECNLLDIRDVPDYKFDNLGMKPIHKVNGKKS